MGWRSTFQLDTHDKELSMLVSREMLQRMWTITRRYRLQIASILICLVLQTLLAILKPQIIMKLVDIALLERDQTMVMQLGVMLVVVPIVDSLITLQKSYVSSLVGVSLTGDLRVMLYSHLTRLSYGWLSLLSLFSFSIT